MTGLTNGTLSARLARERLGRNLRALEADEVMAWLVRAEVPEAWTTLVEDVDCQEVKEQITIRLDRSVVRFYRAMGQGYQRRINRVLATYAQMRIGRVFEMVARMQFEDPDFAPAYRAALGLPPQHHRPDHQREDRRATADQGAKDGSRNGVMVPAITPVSFIQNPSAPSGAR